MAIYGDLETHAFTDVMRVLRNQVGTLFLHMAYQGKTLELLLNRGQLLGLYIDGFPVQNPEQLQEIFHTLTHQGRGKFEFQPGQIRNQMFDVPIDPLVRQVTSVGFIPLDQLPHPETRFTVGRAAEVPASLQGRWSQVAPLLAGGVSARALMDTLGFTEREARQLLYQLRAVDLIMPVRAGQPAQVAAPAPVPAVATYAATEAAPAAAPTAVAAPTPVPAALAALGLDELVPSAPAAAPVPVAQAASGTPVERPVLQKLLGALRRFVGGAR